jgi:hypothetical protein
LLVSARRDRPFVEQASRKEEEGGRDLHSDDDSHDGANVVGIVCPVEAELEGKYDPARTPRAKPTTKIFFQKR